MSHDDDGKFRSEIFLGTVLEYDVSDDLSLEIQLVNNAREKTTGQLSTGDDLAYKLNKDLQVDAGTEFGLNDSSPDLRILVGFTFRFGEGY
jgi:hypothetical protein